MDQINYTFCGNSVQRVTPACFVYLETWPWRLFSPLRHRDWHAFCITHGPLPRSISHSQVLPVYFFTSSNRRLAGLPRVHFASTLPCKTVLAMVRFALTTRPNHLTLLFIMMSSGVSYFQYALRRSCVSPYMAYEWCNATATLFCVDYVLMPRCVSPYLCYY